MSQQISQYEVQIDSDPDSSRVGRLANLNPCFGAAPHPSVV